VGEAIKEYNAAIAANPNAAFACNGLAWTYVSAKDVSKRNVNKALEFITTAVKLSNSNARVFVRSFTEAQYASAPQIKALGNE